MGFSHTHIYEGTNARANKLAQALVTRKYRLYVKFGRILFSNLRYMIPPTWSPGEMHVFEESELGRANLKGDFFFSQKSFKKSHFVHLLTLQKCVETHN